MKQGFSLVELSIVLVILGLLTGGILSGQSLIRAAELRSVSTDIQRLQTTLYTFRDKYMALPGDMRTAGKFWGYANTAGAGGTCAAPATNTGTGTQTCDGNGDGQIGTNAAAAIVYESFRAWQHLANAGLVEGNYTGVAGGGGISDAIPGENVPRMKPSNTGVALRYVAAQSGAGSWFNGPYGNIFTIGRTNAGDAPSGAFVRAEEAWNIDTKVDDGRPAYGKVLMYRTALCVTTTVEATAEYKVSDPAINCPIMALSGL